MFRRSAVFDPSVFLSRCFCLLWLGFPARLSLQAQSGFWSSKDAYLGIAPPGDTPVAFAPSKLKIGSKFTLDRSAFSADGKEYYYTLNQTWFGDSGLATMVVRFRNGKWGKPELVAEHLYGPTFSMDGRTMFLEGDGIWQLKKNKDGWSKPEPYISKSAWSFYGFMPTRSGNIYVGGSPVKDSNRSYNNWDICRATFNHGDTSLTSLGMPPNTTGFDGDFYIAPDESYLIISAKEQPDFKCELWISFRKPDDSWTAPVSLGPLINDGPAHRWGEYVSPDGKYLFYSHGHGPEDCAIMWVRFDSLLEKTRKEALSKN